MPSKNLSVGKGISLCVVGLCLSLTYGIEQRRRPPMPPSERWSDSYHLDSAPSASHLYLGTGYLESPLSLAWWSRERQDVRESSQAKSRAKLDTEKMKTFSDLFASDKVKPEEKIASRLEADYYRATFLEAQGDYSGALEIFDSLSKKGGGPFIDMKKAGCLLQVNRKEEGMAVCEKILQDLPDSPLVLLNAGSIFLRAGAYDRAETCFKTAAELDPRTRSAQVDFARYCVSQGRLEEARSLYEAFLSVPMQKRFMEPNIELAEVMRRQGNVTDAVELLRTLSKAQPRTWSIQMPLARLLASQGLFEEALTEVRQMLSVNPGDKEALQTMALIDLQAGKFEESNTAIDLLLKIDPEDGRSLSLMGDLRYMEKRFDEAEALYRQALARIPSLSGASNNLAWLLLEQNKDLKEAKTFAQQATVFDTRNATYFETLAQILNKMGETEEARAAAARAEAIKAAAPSASLSTPPSP